ncbi:MAG: MFS transporter [Peptococcaceae bacterium]|nr:MFS transporter [Peptococcaceae bacterium]
MSEASVNPKATEVDEPLVKLPKGKKVFFIAILYVMFLFDFIIRYGVNSILPLIQEDLQISSTQVGLLSSAIFLGMAIFVMPISFIGENKSQRRAISFCGILWSAATVVCGMAGSAVNLIINRLLVGAGNSAYAPLSTAMLTSWYKKSSWGKVLGLYNTAMAVGGALGYLIFAAVAEAYGWRSAFYIIGAVSLVVSLLSLLLPDNKKLMAEQGAAEGHNHEAEEIAQIKLNAKDTAKLVLHNRALLTMCLAAGFALFAMNTGSTFLSIYYVNVMDMSVTKAAAMVAAATPVSLIAFPLGGAILDKWYQKDRRARMWMPMISILLSGLILVAGYAVANVPLIIVGNAIYSVGTTSFHTASHELVPAWYKSVSYGTYVLFIQLMGALGPTIGGIIVDAVGVHSALVYVQGFLIISVLLLAYAGKIYLKFYNAARQAEQEKGLGTVTE